MLARQRFSCLSPVSCSVIDDFQCDWSKGLGGSWDPLPSRHLFPTLLSSVRSREITRNPVKQTPAFNYVLTLLEETCFLPSTKSVCIHPHSPSPCIHFPQFLWNSGKPFREYIFSEKSIGKMRKDVSWCTAIRQMRNRFSDFSISKQFSWPNELLLHNSLPLYLKRVKLCS